MNELAIFANDIAMLDNEYRMSLKSITDKLKVRHNDAMSVVRSMSEDYAFGTITKISYTSKMPNNASKSLDTYALTKRQSIAVAARLNTEFLMLVIDRWQELEDAEAQRQKEALALAQQEAQAQAQLAHEAQRALGRTVFEITLRRNENKATLSDWKHRFEPLRCAYLGEADRWGTRYTPKDAVAALAPYAEAAQQMIGLALQVKPALYHALSQSGLSREEAMQVVAAFSSYIKKEGEV